MLPDYVINTSPYKFNITKDYLLGGRVLINQPEKGYRVAHDPILLAASMIPEEGETVLDIGSGVGAASLCLATRVPNVRIYGIEILSDLVRLAADNARDNGLRSRIEFLQGNLVNPPPRLAAGSFDHVMSNPPFIAPNTGRKSPYEIKASANVQDISLEDWVRFCLVMLRPKGTVTFIHRADCLDQLLACLAYKVGGIKVYPLWSFDGQDAKRVIVRGEKNSKAAMRLCAGMVVHKKGGEYTDQAEGVLKLGEGLIL